MRTLESRHAHDLLTSSLIPRPIAWVTTVGPEGRVNIAPFSFFTGVSWSPPILAFSPVNRADGTKKDTVKNIEEIPEFVIHIVSADLLASMEATAKPIPYGGDNPELLGIHLIPSRTVRPPRIEEAAVSFECALERMIRVTEGPDAGNLIIGRIQLMHLRDDVMQDNRTIDPHLLNPLGRLSGSKYCLMDSIIESETN